MTAFVAKAAPGTRAFLDVLAIAAGLAFLLLVAHPAYDYASEEAIVVTPAMEISNAWRAAALPIGVALMILVSLVRLLRVNPLGRSLKAIAWVAAICALFWALGPLLQPLGKLNLLIFFAGVVGACVFAGVPIAFSFALATFGFLALTTRTPMLVLADVIVLFTGVVARYLFHAPIVWSDELASILFLWLSMLGAVVALRRGEHMRMTAFVAKAAPGTRAFLDVLAIAAGLAFCLLYTSPSPRDS